MKNHHHNNTYNNKARETIYITIYIQGRQNH